MRHLALLFALLATSSATGAVRGFPLIEIHPQKDHGGGAQLFSLAQDRDGMLIIGGLRGIVGYDGGGWQTVPLPNQSAAFAVASAGGPEIAIGGVNELGWAARDAQGNIVYHSLLDALPPAQRDLGDVRSVCAAGNGFVYAAEHFIIIWTGGAPRVAADLRNRPPAAPPACFRAGNTAYVALTDGLYRVDTAAATIVPDGFRGKQVELLQPLDGARLLVAVRGEGLFVRDGNAVLPFAPEASAILRGKAITAGCRLPDGRIVIGTREDGLVMLDSSGSIAQRLDAAAGLPDNVLTAALPDREGSLWLAYHGTLARIDLADPLTLIDARSGLRGSATSAGHHDGRTYVTASHGLFVFDDSGVKTLRRVDGIPAPAWDVLTVDSGMLVNTADGVFLLRDGGGVPQRIPGTEGLVFYNALPSTRDPSRIWMTMKKGLGSLVRDGAGWRFAGLVPGIAGYTRDLVEMDGILWVSSVFDGVLRVDPAATPPSIRRIGRGEVTVALIGGRIVVASDDRIYHVAGDRLEPDPLLGHIDGNFFRLAEDARGDVWVNSTPPMVYERLPDGHYARTGRAVGSIDAGAVQMLSPDGDAMWLGAGEVLYRYELGRTAPFPRPRPLIRRVSTAEGAVSAPLPHAFGRLRIEFAPMTFRPGVAYQYRLDPADAAWSAWTPHASIDYTNLDDGDYTFRVRARGADGRVSDETSTTFRVLPPWYRTRPAVALWILAAAALVALIVLLRTKALRRQTARLRTLVDERTEELQQANAHLERLSLLDELTGIANRRYFQRALADDWRTAHEQGQPLALVILDLDHFKLINDRGGHAAGDAALVQVGRYLAREVRRSGDLSLRANDLVARIGGEEFGLLLMHTSEAEAARLAERLRAGIEELQIEGFGTSLRITTSCGVAAVIPGAADGSADLVADADRALYAAKAAGRNCVRASSEERGAREAV